MNAIPTIRPRVLVIDDTPANLRLLFTLLADNGYRVHTASSAQTALRFVQAQVPDLILLDVMMPGLNGFEVCERLKADPRTRDVPVIFISAADNAPEKVRAFSSGGVDYIVKPFQAEEVLARIGTHLALRALQANLEERVRERTAELVDANARLSAEIVERRQAEDRVQFLAHHDALTGLANRVLLEDRVNQAITQARRSRQHVGVLFIDLDHFKDINDSLGHHAGDQLLQEVARRLQACLRQGDSVARLGGDEFVIAIPGIRHRQDATQVAAKALESLRAPFQVGFTELHVSASLGVSLFPADGEDAASLLRAADTAMYHAKERGRDNAQFYMAHLNDAAQRRLAIANRLHQALARGEFAVHYQPQVDLDSGRIFSVEALLRWTAPEFSDVPAGEFIRIAEETGLIVPIGEWVLREACAQLQRWRSEGHENLHVAVNLSPRQLKSPGFHGQVAQALARSGLPDGALELELTEGMLMQQSSENVLLLENLVALGARLAVDDFGTGYSNLGYLRRFPISALKIDQSFVRGIGKDANDTAIVATIMAMAHSLRLKVVAEGVETDEQAAYLFHRGCLAAQGYLYSPPVPAATIGAMLTRQAEGRWAFERECG